MLLNITNTSVLDNKRMKYKHVVLSLANDAFSRLSLYQTESDSFMV